MLKCGQLLNCSNKDFKMSFKVNYFIVITVFIIPLCLSGCYTPLDSSEVPKIVSMEPQVYTGLPSEIENNPDFKAFISNKNGSIDKKLLPFIGGDSIPLLLNSMREPYFDTLGNPILGGSDKDFGPKGIGFSSDKRYLLEIVSSEPDSFAYLWDIKEKKSYQAWSSGPAAKLTGMAWLDRTRFIVWGVMSNPQFDDWLKGCMKFVDIYDLNNRTIVGYASRLIPYEILPFGEEKLK
jgi:hypothetical protein